MAIAYGTDNRKRRTVQTAGVAVSAGSTNQSILCQNITVFLSPQIEKILSSFCGRRCDIPDRFERFSSR